MLFTSAQATQGPSILISTAVGPTPHTDEPSSGLLAVGSCTTGPAPQSQPMRSYRGERKAEKTVLPMPKGTDGDG